MYYRKYRNIKVKLDGMTFDSKKEAAFYNNLKLQQKAGVIKSFICQPKIKFPCKVTYIPDFRVVMGDGVIVYYDVKSEFTRKMQVYRIKIKLLKYFYPDLCFKEV